MICHDLPFKPFGHSTAIYQGYGGYGVLVFFAISGFLITTRILEEERLCGVFEIRRFYIRRFFRIQPAALSYLAVIGLLLAFHVFQDSWYLWIAALFLFVNSLLSGYFPEESRNLRYTSMMQPLVLGTI
jgi:peptidoglycan/LPS O-acetylase OafA/YrhL